MLTIRSSVQVLVELPLLGRSFGSELAITPFSHAPGTCFGVLRGFALSLRSPATDLARVIYEVGSSASESD